MSNVLKYINDAQRFEAKRAVLLATMGSAASAIDRLDKLKTGLVQAIAVAELACSRADAQATPGEGVTLKNRILAARKAILTHRNQARLSELDHVREMADSLQGSLPHSG